MAPESPKRKTARQAIAAHCRSCIYDPAMPGTWRMQTEACTVKTCDLYAHRPHSARKRDNHGEAVRNPVQVEKTEMVTL